MIIIFHISEKIMDCEINNIGKIISIWKNKKLNPYVRKLVMHGGENKIPDKLNI